ncbi:hypothetical protein [Streptosporangium saharense]|uniref:Uncharacterized protein n=1 Tax=Streptosporangium saharense TaxID=1706840 RepID=A0A7W7VKZ3_9ACTN|nr:hypothetical protein [Streptosporangium saharense]MBB4914221.1 hypothetical protein [Streptosporangium saharense]
MTRRWALMVASCVLATVASLMVIAVATYEGRAARDRARGPIVTEPQDAIAWWSSRFDSVGHFQHSVVLVEPLGTSAPPPPGLTRWPAPGEAMLSPELLSRGAAEGIRTRYGRFGGLIGREGLVAPSERLAYVRPPAPPNTDSWLPISGFGRPFPLVETLNQRDLPEVLLALGALTLLPALALMATASRTGNRKRGALKEAPPLAIGSAAGSLPLILTASTDLPIPATGYILNSTDIRAAWPLACATLLTSFATGLALVTLLQTKRDRAAQNDRDIGKDHEAQSDRKARGEQDSEKKRNAGRDREAEEVSAARPRPVPRWRLVACALAVATIALSQYVPSTGGLITFAVGTIGMWLLLPSLTTALIDGQRLAAHPKPLARLSTALIILLGTVTLLQIWEGHLGETARAALATERRIGDTLLVVRTAEHPNLEAFSRALPASSALAVLLTSENGEHATLIGPCGTLRTLKLPCTTTPAPVNPEDSRLQELQVWYGLRTLTSQVGRGRTEQTRNLLVVVSDTRGQYPQVARAAYATLPVLETTIPGSGWIDAATPRTRLGTWLTLFGLAGVLILLLTTWLSTPRWHLTIPLLTMTALVIATTTWHALFFIAVTKDGALPWHLPAATTAACTLLALTAGLPRKP